MYFKFIKIRKINNMLTTKLNTSREVLFSFVILEDTSITFQYGSIHYEL